MARIRTIKPDFFRHEDLYEAEERHKMPLRLAFAGLWTVADREGRFKWSPRQLKLDALPYDNIDFEKALDALALYGFIVKYKHEGKVYGYIPSWKMHQVVNHREAASKIPDPELLSEACTEVDTAKPTQSTGTPRHTQGEREQEGEKEREGKRNRKNTTCAELKHSSTPKSDEAPPLITLPLCNKTDFPITVLQVEQWQELYPSVDVMQSLRSMRGWCLANPTKAKTPKGILRFINTWLAKEQDRGGGVKGGNVVHFQQRSPMTLAERNQRVGEEWANESVAAEF